ncbi:MAG: 3-dehydroquinate synthase [Pyrinomonadaceae bacterium]
MKYLQKIVVEIDAKTHRYDVAVGAGILRSTGRFITDSCGVELRRIAVISNKKVFGLYGEAVVREIETAGVSPMIFLMKDGERHKNFRSLQQVLEFLSESKLARTDAVVALGGGVVGDLAGFAASVYLRGVAFLQVPTTMLAMIDSSVGGKTGVNTEFGKNLIGAFYQPKGVLIDAATLATLPKRELTAGFCEAIKQGAISGMPLFGKTQEFLEKYPINKGKFSDADAKFVDNLCDLLASQIAFKASVVKLDERESAANVQPTSRKILNFGHTFAHALERATDYKYLKHGEAVGWGIIFAAEISKKLGLLDAEVVNLLRGVVHRAGDLPRIENIDPAAVAAAITYDKKNISGELQWVLLNGIGKPAIIPHSQIGDRLVRQTITQFLH